MENDTEQEIWGQFVDLENSQPVLSFRTGHLTKANSAKTKHSLILMSFIVSILATIISITVVTIGSVMLTVNREILAPPA